MKKKKKTERSNNINIIPVGDKVLIKPIVIELKEEKTKSGIIIPVSIVDQENKERPEQGVVIAAGPGKYSDGKIVPMNVKVGQKVLFKPSYSEEKTIKISGQEYYLIGQESILGIIK